MDEKMCHILVVDDNHINRQYLESVLTQAGHQVTTANNGQQALDISTTTLFDLVFIDLQMPRLDGIETTLQLKHSGKNKRTAVVGVSAEAIKETDSLCFSDTMIKPLKIKDVLNVINLFCTSNPLFNHDKALKTSHNDETIALKLRDLFVQDLPTQLAKADDFMKKGEVAELQSQLHYILGGAQVCAADGLIQLISELKHRLNSTGFRDKSSEQLWLEINVMNAAMQKQK